MNQNRCEDIYINYIKDIVSYNRRKLNEWANNNHINATSANML